jgi:predicted transcriptional regulator
VTGWTFLTNHAHVLLCVAQDPGMRLRDVADHVGITERAAQRIVAELVEAGYLTRQREGRRNRYAVHPELPLRHPLERGHDIGEILAVLTGPGQGRSDGTAKAPDTDTPVTG